MSRFSFLANRIRREMYILTIKIFDIVSYTPYIINTTCIPYTSIFLMEKINS